MTSYSYYKGLFGPPYVNGVSLQEDRNEDISQVSSTKNEILASPFFEQEIRDVFFQMEHNKAPGPDGFPAEIYKVFWEVIKGDLLALVKGFHEE